MQQQNTIKLLAQISKIGNNLNQIAKHTNTNKAIDKLTLVSLYNIEHELNILLKKYYAS